MLEISSVLTEVKTILAAERLDWALVGGLAVSTRAEPRFTRDVDIALAVRDDAEAERIAFRLSAHGLLQSDVMEQTYVERLSTVRMIRQSGGAAVYIDLLFASSGLEREIVEAAQAIEVFPDLVAPVATVGHLLATKVLSQADGRTKDIVDIESLLQVATDDDLALARASVRLIAARGYDRGHDVVAMLETFLIRQYGR